VWQALQRTVKVAGSAPAQMLVAGGGPLATGGVVVGMVMVVGPVDAGGGVPVVPVGAGVGVPVVGLGVGVPLFCPPVAVGVGAGFWDDVCGEPGGGAAEQPTKPNDANALASTTAPK
jgi:hypothetical protein